MAEIRTKRWNDPVEQPADGTRILICRFRPRGVSKADETWDQWVPDLGTSKSLHAAVYGKTGGSPLPWASYRMLYLREMQLQRAQIAQLADRVENGETITLLCSSACTRESRCHRSLLKELIEAELAGPVSA
jgi:uncharacterized protein YeaO (DUF488 family)